MANISPTSQALLICQYENTCCQIRHKSPCAFLGSAGRLTKAFAVGAVIICWSSHHQLGFSSTRRFPPYSRQIIFNPCFVASMHIEHVTFRLPCPIAYSPRISQSRFCLVPPVKKWSVTGSFDFLVCHHYLAGPCHDPAA